jgi:ABC-type sugar transport system ATPase subunit
MPNSSAGEPPVRTTKADEAIPGTAALSLRGVERRFRSSRGIGPIDLSLCRGERVTLLGESGSGKSTLLSIIAGLERADRGTIEIEGRRVDRLPPGRRDVALVAQDLPLYDHLDVRANVELAVSGLKLDRSERDHRVSAAMGTADATDFIGRRADTLSGGERARVCLARILARRPTVALLDEPFSGLDRARRASIRDLVFSTLGAAGTAILLVTHDESDIQSDGRTLEIDPEGRLIPV